MIHGSRLASAGRSRVVETKTQLEGIARLLRGLTPEKTLRRGFSITRDSEGRVLRGPEQVTSGETIKTELAGGDLVSRVEDA